MGVAKRELENLCQRVTLLSDTPVLSMEFFPHSTPEGDPAPNAFSGLVTHVPVIFNDMITLPAEGISPTELEGKIIKRALEMNAFNQSRTARFLNIPRHVFLYRMEKYAIEPERDA